MYRLLLLLCLLPVGGVARSTDSLRLARVDSALVTLVSRDSLFLREVDVTTGRYGNARTLVDNRIVFEREHPDTGVVIEGELPHWDDIRRKILAIARSAPQLEYLGFDVAITTDGFRLLEVNRYPDYPRISRLTPETISYLLMKIEDKKRFRKVDENPSFFKLPRRDA